MREQKVFAGPRIKHLRQSRGLTQAAMARHLGISASYLNLVENNQRPLTTQLLLKLAASYDLDIRELSGEREAKITAELTEALADPFFKTSLAQRDLADFAQSHPDIANAFVRLYGEYQKINSTGRTPTPTPDKDTPNRFPIDEVGDLFLQNNNHYTDLDERAEQVYEQMAGQDLLEGLTKRLRDHHGVRVSILPLHALPDTQRHYDRHNQRLFLSEMLPRASQIFQTAVQLAFLGFEEAIEREVKRATPSSEEATRLYRIGLGNYFAGAVMMPLTQFTAAAKELRYDLDILSSRFGASIEQVAQRLTSLQRPGSDAIPFFLLRIDHAGNISKQISAAGFRFPRFGSTCPRWNIHDAFLTHGRSNVQVVALSDRTRFLTISRQVTSLKRPYGQDRRKLAIALGCDIAHAGEIVYGDGLNLEDATPIGITCRVCERPNCTTRAAPPMTRPLFIDTWRKGVSAFEF